jgi:hypothetical protein
MKRVVQVNRIDKVITGGPWLYQDSFNPSGDLLLESTALAGGFVYPPPQPPPVPESVPAWALQAYMDSIGKLIAMQNAVDSYIGSDAIKVQWIFRRGEMFPRYTDATNAIGLAMGLTPSQIDDAFRKAEQLAN